MNALPRCRASCRASSVFPTPVGPVNRNDPAGRSGLPQTGARALDGGDDRRHRPLLAEHDAFERFLQRAQPLLVGCRRLLLRDAGHPGDDAFQRAGRHRGGLGLFRGGTLQRKTRARLVDHVERAVGQPGLPQMAARQPRGGPDRLVAVAHAVVALVARAQALQNAGRLLDRRLVDHYLLQPPRQRAILLDLLELVEGRGADDTQLAGSQHRLDQSGQIHRAAGRRARADRGVHFVDEQDGQRMIREALDDRLEALLEIAAEAGAGQQRGRVERKQLGALQPRRRVVVRQEDGEPFSQGRLADAGIADEYRVVLAPPAQYFHRPAQLGGAPDQRVEASLPRLQGEVDRVRGQRVARRGRRILAAPRRPAVGRCFLARAPRLLRDAVGDVVQHVEPRDPLRVEQLRGVRLRLLEDGGQHVARAHLLAAGALHVQHRGLQHPPEPERLGRLVLVAARASRACPGTRRASGAARGGPRRSRPGCARPRDRARGCTAGARG